MQATKIFAGILLVTATIALVGCGKSADEEAREEKERSILEVEQAGDSLGIPTAEWTEEQFAEYEKVLKAAEARWLKIVGANWNPNDAVTKGLMTKVVLLKSARVQKESRPKYEPDRVALQKDVMLLSANGVPDSTWTRKKLEEYDHELSFLELRLFNLTFLIGPAAVKIERVLLEAMRRDFDKIAGNLKQ